MRGRGRIELYRRLLILMNPISYLIALMLTAPVAQVESNGNECAYNKAEDAAGCMQIRPIMVAEAQRLGLNFTLEDRWDCDKSKGLFVAMQVLKGRTNPEVMARCWNGGPNGMSLEDTEGYWEKVRKSLSNLNI